MTSICHPVWHCLDSPKSIVLESAVVYLDSDCSTRLSGHQGNVQQRNPLLIDLTEVQPALLHIGDRRRDRNRKQVPACMIRPCSREGNYCGSNLLFCWKLDFRFLRKKKVIVKWLSVNTSNTSCHYVGCWHDFYHFLNFEKLVSIQQFCKFTGDVLTRCQIYNL